MEPRVSVSQITTFRSSFADDLRAYAAAGLDGIGIWELKLGDDSLERFRASGLAAASAVPAVPSILPLPLLGGPEHPQERLAAYIASMERLAPYEPPALVLLTGTGERDVAVDGLRTLAGEADRLGLRLALEPYQRDGGELWSVVHSIPEALELIHDAGDPANVGIQFDVWHLWNTESLYDDIREHVDRFFGVHVCDRREPTRGWADRALPGDGSADVPAILRALRDAGWDGLYDLEIFSDDGTFGSEYPDSFWAAPAEETLARAQAAFERCWSLIPQEVEEAR
ncbi:MAG TPA: sugar phosphate isomerase/epimerase [Gaiellaceae bacterium]